MKKILGSPVFYWCLCFLNLFFAIYNIATQFSEDATIYFVFAIALAYIGIKVKAKKDNPEQTSNMPKQEQKPKYRYPSHAILVPDDQYGFWGRSLRNKKATLKFDPECSYDRNAIAVCKGRFIVGYLFDGTSKDHAREWLKKGWPYEAHFLDGKIYEDIRGDAGKIALFFYAPLAE